MVDKLDSTKTDLSNLAEDTLESKKQPKEWQKVFVTYWWWIAICDCQRKDRQHTKIKKKKVV